MQMLFAFSYFVLHHMLITGQKVMLVNEIKSKWISILKPNKRLYWLWIIFGFWFDISP